MSPVMVFPDALVISLVSLAWLLVLGIPLLVTFCKRQTRYPHPKYTGGEIHHQEREGVPAWLSHGGHTFEVFCECPRCGKYDIHALDTPNPESPVVDDWREVISSWAGDTIKVITPTPDRPDEREWAVARVCRCGERFGQT